MQPLFLLRILDQKLSLVQPATTYNCFKPLCGASSNRNLYTSLMYSIRSV